MTPVQHRVRAAVCIVSVLLYGAFYVLGCVPITLGAGELGVAALGAGVLAVAVVLYGALYVLGNVAPVLGVGPPQRDGRIAAVETIGAALSALRRLDHVWYDEDVRETLSQARAALAKAQSKIRERIGS